MSQVMPPPTPPASPPPPPPAARQRWGPGRVVAAILAGLVLLSGFGMLLGGVALALGSELMRDDDGFLTSPEAEWRSEGYAVRTESAEIHVDAGAVDVPRRLLGEVQVTADPTTDAGVFVGIARTSDVDRYLAGVAQSVVVESWGDEQTDMQFVDGGAPRAEPDAEDFWEASASGRDPQTITWEPRSGDWTLVVMNGEGTTPVDALVTVGAEAPVVGTVGVVLLVAGLVVAGLGALGLVLVVWRR
jgi:hypothetical protein